jgi:hypothetical protein
LGHASQALAALSTRLKVAPLTDEVRAKVRELFPDRLEGLDDVARPLDDVNIRFDPNDAALKKVLRTVLHKGKSPGPSGMAEEHLRWVLKDEVVYRALLRLLERIVNGRVGPRATRLLQAAKLFPLRPSAEGDGPVVKIRPIACGELIGRLAARLALHTVESRFSTLFGNLQLGVGTPGGAQAAATAHLHSWRAGYVVVESDLVNAYGRMSRRICLERFAEYSSLTPLRTLRTGF